MLVHCWDQLPVIKLFSIFPVFSPCSIFCLGGIVFLLQTVWWVAENHRWILRPFKRLWALQLELINYWCFGWIYLVYEGIFLF